MAGRNIIVIAVYFITCKTTYSPRSSHKLQSEPTITTDNPIWYRFCILGCEVNSFFLYPEFISRNFWEGCLCGRDIGKASSFTFGAAKGDPSTSPKASEVFWGYNLYGDFETMQQLYRKPDCIIMGKKTCCLEVFCPKEILEYIIHTLIIRILRKLKNN